MFTVLTSRVKAVEDYFKKKEREENKIPKDLFLNLVGGGKWSRDNNNNNRRKEGRKEPNINQQRQQGNHGLQLTHLRLLSPIQPTTKKKKYHRHLSLF
jgi:hypothetical protein